GKLIRCIQKGISVISMHLNLDTAKGGIDESMMEGILHSAGAGVRSNEGVCIMHPLSNGAYGRVYALPELSLQALVEGLKSTFSTERVLAYGSEEKRIGKIASFCGAGADEYSIAFAKREGADAVVSADFKHHLIMLAQELGLAVIVMTHYASENYGFKKYYEKIRGQVEIPCVYHTDNSLL
ncbi:MAG: Nif3-like dinuclear metal center hexameric protein, partial [Clostridia bacterium]|nr:Nif3-like dinuclear metal center hexameric protein [Clostridia bacterium]